MRRILALLIVVAASSCGATADGSPLASASPAPLANERLLIEGTASTDIVEAATGHTVRSLVPGIVAPAADLVVRVASDGTAKTAVDGIDLKGHADFGLALGGAYALPAAYGPAPSGFSPNGKWLVLVEHGTADSHYAVIDVGHAKLAKTITLSSRFTFDAIHNDGSAMYLIEHPTAGSTKYNVRFYDLTAGVLKPDIIFDKAAIGAVFDPTAGLMDGTFHVSVAPTSGDWSYGLYVRANNTPFVHALNVPGHYATCILDLAGSWSPASMFSLTLTSDGRRLYVVDTVQGNVSVIDGLTQKVVRKASFATKHGTGDPLAASAVVSPDGARLYATAPQGIAMLQTTDLALRAWLAPDLSSRSLAISSDGSQLYALAGDEVVVIDARTGATLARYAAPVGARALRLLPNDAATRP